MNHYVRWVRHVNEWVGRIAGLLIVAVVLIIIKEVMARGAFNAPSLWADESMTYLAGMAYALGGGFTLLHRKHVIVDLVYQPIANRGGSIKNVVDVVAFVLFSIYCLTLVYFGWELAINSIREHEGSGTLWNPALWPVKLAIPVAGALLLLQGLANLLVDLGLVSGFINLAAFDAAGIPDRCVANPRHGGAMAVVCALRSGRQQPPGAHADS